MAMYIVHGVLVLVFSSAKEETFPGRLAHFGPGLGERGDAGWRGR